MSTEPWTLRGTGSIRKTDASLYNSKDMTKDMAEILDHESIKHVIVAGHDWGSFLAARMWLWHPERRVGLILLNVAYTPPGQQAFNLDEVNQMYEQYVGQPLLAYWEPFTAPDAPKLILDNLEAFWCVLHGDEPEWMTKMFTTRGGLREFLEGDKRVPLKPYAQDKARHDRFIARIQHDGMEAPLQWYFAMKDNYHHELEKTLSPERLKVTVPVLFISCTGDVVCRTEAIYEPQKAGLLPELTVKEITSGHWCTIEAPDEVGSTMVEWLKEKKISAAS